MGHDFGGDLRSCVFGHNNRRESFAKGLSLSAAAGTSADLNGLKLQGVARRFGARLAVDHVTFEVKRGEVLCLLGPSGCGKTTTLRIAAGLERPDSGLVFVGGLLVEGNGRHEPPETRRVGLMFQDYALFPHLSVRANV